MSIAGLGTYSSSGYYYKAVTKSRSGSLSNVSDDYFDTDDILEKMNYLEKVNDLRNENVMDKAKSMIDYANRLFDDFRQMMNAKEDINSLFEPYFMKFLSMDITQIEQSEEPDVTERLSDVHSSEKIQEEKAEDEQVTPLGIGFAKAGEMGYGMSASLVTKTGSDDTIIRVKVATGSGSETIDVNLSNFDPKNATPVEMFAYCQYKDANGEGVNSKWGSWNAMKSVMYPTDGADFGSLDNIMNKKMNWTDALAKSKTILENEKTKETISAADILKLFEETHTITAQELKEEKDWREMSDDEWDNLLEGIDKYIDAFKERIKQLKEMQDEAAQKAALEADSDMRATAASAAALSAATNGLGATFGGATKTTKAGDEVQFPKNVMKCVACGDQKVMLCQDALMSYASPQTGESVNIYRSDSYTEDNPIYIIKGLDADGNAYEQEVDASKINPNRCSYNELMVLNVETGHTSPSDYLHAVAVRDKAGTDSFSESTNYIAYMEAVMKDMKMLEQWDSYLAYDKWLNDITTYVSKR